MAFKLRFLREQKEGIEQRRLQSEDRSQLPLAKVADLYFGWKAANSAPATISRERRMFRNIEKAMGKTTLLRAVDLELIREYQQERRKQISPTMKSSSGIPNGYHTAGDKRKAAKKMIRQTRLIRQANRQMPAAIV